MIICGDKSKAKQILKSSETCGDTNSKRGNSAGPKKHLKDWNMHGGVFPAELASESSQAWADDAAKKPNLSTQKMEDLLSGRETSQSSMSKVTAAGVSVSVASSKDERDNA
ncbi:hypothetical protein ElyMa_002200200 [Elysia marginata]|uniref:Uncharacterized protein n=1 Tax=Elysia marginata TaxID=1093978 RepID=A0AAV4FSL0_9GAST|nr:hypothetical protein ElyMa_002200200 [Elysia marginata]